MLRAHLRSIGQLLPATAALALLAGPGPAQTPAELARTVVAAVRKVNEEHAREPGKEGEEELKKKLPAAARAALDKLVAAADAPGLPQALADAAEAALDLDLAEDFVRLRARLARAAPGQAAQLGVALSRPRFLLRGHNGLDEAYLAKFAEVLDGILAAYDELFGFAEFSKVPGKKLRVRVHLEDKITRPPHFAPEFPFHSEVDCPVIDKERLTSPTADGKFQFYGLCHELGHVIAMWGDRNKEEDLHQWAHYTGVAIVAHLAKTQANAAWMRGLEDVRWRSLEKERQALAKVAPSVKDKQGTLKLLVDLHDKVGPRSIGAAINWLDKEDKRLRINGVRYYSFGELKRGLLAVVKEAGKRKAVEALLQ